MQHSCTHVWHTVCSHTWTLCCSLSLTLCFIHSKPITLFFFCCSKHTQLCAHIAMLSLRPYSISLAYPPAVSHIIPQTHNPYLNLFSLSGGVVAVCWEYHPQPSCLKKYTSPVAWSVHECVSLEWGFATPDTVISSSRMYFLSGWRCGRRREGGGSTDNTSLSNVFSHDSACHSRPTCTLVHAPTWIHVHLYTNTHQHQVVFDW